MDEDSLARWFGLDLQDHPDFVVAPFLRTAPAAPRLALSHPRQDVSRPVRAALDRDPAFGYKAAMQREPAFRARITGPAG
jgi:hypothetical protein